MENFETIFERIMQETDIKSISKLAEAIGRKQPSISESRKKGVFQPQWAYELELKTGLNTRWIMTGEGPKRLNAVETTTPFLAELEKWAREISKDGSLDWLEQQLAVCLPTWQMWREKKKAEAAPAETDQVA